MVAHFAVDNFFPTNYKTRKILIFGRDVITTSIKQHSSDVISLAVPLCPGLSYIYNYAKIFLKITPCR